MTIPTLALPWAKRPEPRLRLRVSLALALGLGAAVAAAGCAHRAAPTPPTPPPAAAVPTPAASGAQPAPDPDAAKMPDGAGKAEVVSLCTSCHTLARVVRQHQTQAQWQDTLHSMQDNGLEASPAQLNAMVGYLSKNYGPKAP